MVLLFALVTQLGDVWFLFLLGGVLYTGGVALPRLQVERGEGLFIIALIIAYLSLIGVLKDLLLLPRPPGATDTTSMDTVDVRRSLQKSHNCGGPGFPSGHALGTTMVRGGLALVVDRGRVRTRVGIAGTAIALVSVSRLILGVHYVVDVFAGILLGIVILGGLYVLADYGADSERVLLVAVVIGALGLVVNLNFDSVAAVGGAVGAWVVWRRVAESTPTRPTETDEVLVALVVAVLAAVNFGAVHALRLPYSLTFLGTAMATGLTVSAPFLGERFV